MRPCESINAHEGSGDTFLIRDKPTDINACRQGFAFNGNLVGSRGELGIGKHSDLTPDNVVENEPGVRSVSNRESNRCVVDKRIRIDAVE